jgi:hypothetical protein
MKESAITRSARGQACTLKLDDCLNDNGATTVFAHKNGGGMGEKVKDDQGRDVGAYLCRYCHDVVDGRIQHSYWKPHFIEEMFDFAIRRTDRILKKKGLK